MNKKFDYILSTIGIAWSVQDLQNIISLILLIISLLNILWKGGYSIYTHVKNKEFNKIESDIKESKEELEKLNNTINKEEK